MTSLCPTLGKRYSEIKLGKCPSHLQHPRGKELPVSIFGGFPYYRKPKTKGERIGGTDIQILDIYAEKFDFTPKVFSSPSFDDPKGMIDTVRNIIHIVCLF